MVEEIRQAPELAGPALARTVSELVAIPSVNGQHDEAAMAASVAKRLQAIGCDVQTIEVKPGRPSVGARLTGLGPGETSVVLNGHMDCVPIGDASRWSVPPFEGLVRDGCVFGRGACDMKGGLATQLAVAQFLANRRERFGGSLVLHFAMGEERGEPGTLALLEAGFVADLGVSTEPSNLELGVAVRGLLNLRVTIPGIPAHGGALDGSDNPIRHLPALLKAFEAEDLRVRKVEHPLLGTGTWTVTNVHAGTFASVVADRCDLIIDRRLLPGDSIEAVVARCEAIVAEVTGPGVGRVTIEDAEGTYEPAEVAADSDIAQAVAGAVEEVGGRRPTIVGMGYASDVRNLVNDGGIPSVTFGAGDIAWAHAFDERIEIDALETAARSLALFAWQTLSVVAK
jgi:succinyl-diaminopimelate desuccinylase